MSDLVSVWGREVTIFEVSLSYYMLLRLNSVIHWSLLRGIGRVLIEKEIIKNTNETTKLLNEMRSETIHHDGKVMWEYNRVGRRDDKT